MYSPAQLAAFVIFRYLCQMLFVEHAAWFPKLWLIERQAHWVGVAPGLLC